MVVLAEHPRLLEEARTRKRRTFARMWFVRVAAAVLTLGGWELAAKAKLLDVVNVSHPIGIYEYLVEIFRTGEVWPNLWATTFAAMLGLGLGSASGILAGILLDISPLVSRALDPYIIVLNSMPRPALAPIFLLWFGLGTVPKVLIAASIVFFVLLLTTRAGLQTVDRDIEMLMRVYGMNKRQQFVKVRLINATPSIIAGLRLGAVYSVLGVVVTEMVASQVGLGQMVVFETGRFNTDGAFAVIFLLAVIATFFDIGISILERKFAWNTNTD